jgi:3-dehydroquinate synthase
MIGAFYQPEFVYINIKTLNTLPYEQIAAGMAEAIKYGYIIDKDFLNYFKDNMEKIKKLSPKEIKQIIYTSCKAKAYVVSEDEKESGLREILNFGHTFGHSIESLSNFELLHGECVAIGIISALKLSLDRGYINQIDLNFAKKLFSFFELPINIKDFDKNKIFKQMFSDKKTKNNKLNIVLLKKIGSAYTEKNVSDQEVLNAIEYIVK